jgi:hypothetical protein
MSRTLLLCGLVFLPTIAVAQGFTPVAVTMRGANHSPIAALYSSRTTHDLGVADTAQARQHSIAPFLAWGAILGGVVGALLAKWYSFCGESSYVTCTETSTLDGAILGSIVGVVGGFLVWVISAPPKPAPPVK